jgi:hypothetical protein
MWIICPREGNITRQKGFSRCGGGMVAVESLIQEFIDYLGHEKGLANNTLESYSRDLKQYYAS